MTSDQRRKISFSQNFFRSFPRADAARIFAGDFVTKIKDNKVKHANKRLEIVYRDPATLKPNPRNARTHSDEQIEKLARSIEHFGFINSVYIDKDLGILAGHGRVEAVLRHHRDKIKEVPTVDISHLTAAQRRAYMLADNQIALQAGWDSDILSSELAELAEAGFDVSVIGFDDSELDDMIGGEALDEPPAPNDVTRHLVLVEFDSEAQCAAFFEEIQARGLTCKIMS